MNTYSIEENRYPSAAEIDNYIELQRRRFRIPGVSLAIVEGNQTVHFRGFGHARPHGEVPGYQTPFFIGSVTKSFTALAVMQLVEARKVDLDAPVQRYLPWFRVADESASMKMTVRHLLNHTSGLSMLQGQIILSNMDNSRNASEVQIKALSNAKLSSAVGTKFEYNNTNYNILGLIIESASGESYASYIQNHIFNPLCMTHSYANLDDANLKGLAMGYRYWFGFPIPSPNLLIPEGSIASGQLISTAEDMTHYLIAQLNGGRYGEAQILSPEGIDEMHRGVVAMRVFGKTYGSYGMGWECHFKDNTTIVSHSGIVPNFGTFAGLIPEQKKGIVLLYNVNHAMMKMTFDEFGMAAAERLAELKPSKTMLTAAPLVMHSMAVIPILQLAGVLVTLKRLKLKKSNIIRNSHRLRNTDIATWLLEIPNLIAALMAIPLLTQMRGWIKLFMPDFSSIAELCGGFAIIWILLRLVLFSKWTPKHNSVN